MDIRNQLWSDDMDYAIDGNLGIIIAALGSWAMIGVAIWLYRMGEDYE